MVADYLGPYRLGPNDTPENGIYTGDACELIERIPADSVDIVITSPPYNLGNNHHTGNFRHKQYADDLPENGYQEQQIAMLAGLYRVVKRDGSLLYNHKNRIKNGISLTPYRWLLKTSWIIKQELVWFNGSPNFAKIRFYPMTERIYWMTKTPSVKLVNTIGHHDVFNWNPVGTKGKHTRAFPEQMVADLLVCFPRASVVLDPYGGSCTVPAVCKMLGRRYLAFEIDPGVAQMARERVRNTQPPLFVPQPEQAKIQWSQ